MMIEERSTEIVNLMIPWDGVHLLGYGHISHCCKFALSSTLSI